MNIHEVVQNSIQAEAEENFSEALKILQKALIECAKEEIYLLSEIAELYYRHAYHLESIYTLIKCYRQSKLEKIKDLLLYRYYKPNQELFQRNYEENKIILSEYPFVYEEISPKYLDIIEKIIWIDEKRVIYLDEKDFEEYSFTSLEFIDLHQEEVVFLSNCFALGSIIQLEKFLQAPQFLWSKSPFYLYYEAQLWRLFLQTNRLKSLKDTKRIVFLIGETQLNKYFADFQAIWPTQLDGDLKKIQGILLETRKKQVFTMNQAMIELRQYYAENKEKIVERIKEGKMRILFITSRFTTALQYHTRDCKLVCEELGLETEIVIEKSDIHRNSDMYIKISQFKPDIIFCLDHFRFEFSSIPPEVIFVTWIQDIMPLIDDPNTPERLGKRDFILNHYMKSKTILHADYSKNNEILAPIPCNEKRYKPYILTDEEQEKYGCDICLVCHASNFSKAVENLLIQLPDSIKNSIKKIAQKYLTLLYKEEETFYFKEAHRAFLEKELQEEKCVIEPEMMGFIVEQFYLNKQQALRVVLARWLIETGYTNIKLWGRGWQEQEEFQPYSMGPAENGETLSKILQASKINLGNNPHTTAAARAWETMLSGGFYLSNYIPPKDDLVDIRTILEEDQEIEFFYSKQDLFEKIDYYLSHEEKRKQIAEIGRKKALETMTFNKLMKKMIQEIQNKL